MWTDRKDEDNQAMRQDLMHVYVRLQTLSVTIEHNIFTF